MPTQLSSLTSNLYLEVEVPIAGFRESRSREYATTYPVPPPSTIYGMLLSMVGECNRRRHRGTKLAVALLSYPEKSTVIRTFRRFKKKDIADPSNARPDYQELLTDIHLWIVVNSQDDHSEIALTDRLRSAFEHPEIVDRFGGLSLGESRDLVNAASLRSPNDHVSNRQFRWLRQDQDGLLALPYWVDHVGSAGTRWRRYLDPSELDVTPEPQPPDDAAYWTVITDE
jgi:CRISPR-associated protein Cas5t